LRCAHPSSPQLRQLKLAAIQEGSSNYVLKAELERAKSSLASMESTRDSMQGDASERFAIHELLCHCSLTLIQARAAPGAAEIGAAGF
jgi:hypothetical protein